METARLPGLDLHYEVTGRAEPVLLISTGPIADSFRPLASQPALAGHRLIRYRQRQAGPGSPAPVAFAQHAADAAALLEHLGIRRAHVAGHSTGAAIALQLALDRPELVQTLALLEPPLLGVASAGAFFKQAAPALSAYGDGDPATAMRRFLAMVCSLDWEACRALLDRRIPGGAAQALADADNFFASVLPALGAWRFDAECAAAIGQPVLSVLGRATAPLFVDGHALLQAWFPQLEDCVVDGVAHLLHLQQPEPVAQGLAGFFARHPIDAGRDTAGTAPARASVAPA